MQQVGDEQNAVLTRAEKAVLGEIWTSKRAYENLVYLCDQIGNRWAGSESEHRAAQFLQTKALEYGLQGVTIQTFPLTGWRRGLTRLEVVSPVAREVAAIALPYTPAARLEGEAIWVGQGEAEDFERLSGQIAGKIVLSAAETTPGPGQHSSHRREKFARAIAAGAVAFLFVNQNPGGLAITGALAAGFPAEIPGLGLPKEAGDFIVRLLSAGPVRLRLQIGSEFFPTTSANVLGQIGPAWAGQYILTGAHYDAHDIAFGALDNAAGAVVVLEAVRALATVADTLSIPIRMALFGCEEIGLLGAWYHASQAGDELERCRFVLNVDSPVGPVPGNETLRLCGFPELVPYFEGISREMGYDLPVQDRLNAYSDHFPFAVAGVPNGMLGSSSAGTGLVGRGWGHTPADTVDKVAPKSLQTAAATVARLLLRLARADDWPGKHRSRAEMAATVAESPIGWYVEKFGRYPFQPAERALTL